MENFDIINKIIEQQIKKGNKNFAIYPFGKNGIAVKEILNWRYGVQEAVIVDNKLSGINPNIYALNEITSPEQYIWLLSCSNPSLYGEILDSIKLLNIPENHIVDIFNRSPLYAETKYKILSKIGQPETNSEPCIEFIELVKKKKLEEKTISIAEIGADIGATSVEACLQLGSNDTYYCFDFEEKVDNLVGDLQKVEGVSCHLMGKGNSHKSLDSYNWSLSNLLFQMRRNGLDGIFDVVYLDGAHNFIHDGLTCCLLKELLKSDGYIIFDDMYWSYANSDTCNPKVLPEINNMFTEEQINDCQIRRVVNAFMIHDRDFEQIYMTESINPMRAVFHKK